MLYRNDCLYEYTGSWGGKKTLICTGPVSACSQNLMLSWIFVNINLGHISESSIWINCKLYIVQMVWTFFFEWRTYFIYVIHLQLTEDVSCHDFLLPWKESVKAELLSHFTSQEVLLTFGNASLIFGTLPSLVFLLLFLLKKGYFFCIPLNIAVLGLSSSPALY